MAAEFDATEFVDEDLEQGRCAGAQTPGQARAGAGGPSPAPTREEVDSKLADLQSKLADLKREQTDVERERAAMEETRRRQLEFSTGREELIRDLSRGIQVLEESEIAARRDAEQMAKSLKDLKDSLSKLQSIQQETWTRENLTAELSRALGTADHARMEWNSARLKFPILSGAAEMAGAAAGEKKPAASWEGKPFLEQARLGLALTWPIALAALAIFLTLLFRH
jgi:hypothetical protein